MSAKENPHKAGIPTLTNINNSIVGRKNINLFAGSLEEQTRRKWKQRPAESSEPPPRRRRYMRLRKLVYASRYDLPTLPERIATFAAENDLPVTAVALEAQAIMTEWQFAQPRAQVGECSYE